MDFLISENQKSGIRAWVKLIRAMDEDRAITFMTRIVKNLAGDKMELDAVLDATKDQKPS